MKVLWWIRWKERRAKKQAQVFVDNYLYNYRSRHLVRSYLKLSGRTALHVRRILWSQKNDAKFAVLLLSQISGKKAEALLLRSDSTKYGIGELTECFNLQNPEISRWFCVNDRSIRAARHSGCQVPDDILQPAIQRAAQRGDLDGLTVLYGPSPPHHLLEVCMENAGPKHRLECAKRLLNYRVIAEVLSIYGTPHEMLTGKRYLEGVAEASELMEE